MIDLGRADMRPALTDFARLAAQDFRRNPALEQAFLDGYGRDPRERDAWYRTRVREAIGTAGWAYLIIRYHASMRIMTATEASRHFSELLDAVERGERVTILRGNHPIAEIGPAHRRTGADLRTALEGTPPPDEAFARNISAALTMVTSEVPDPWADA